MDEMSQEMNDCITACVNCHTACLRTATSYRTDPVNSNEHLVLLLACAGMCRTCADFMIIGTLHHKHTCKECAEICLECAAACETIGGMQECVDACRACADCCEKMAA